MNNDPRGDSSPQQPPFSVPSEQYGSQADATTPNFYPEQPPAGPYGQPGAPGIPSMPTPGGVAPTTPASIPPPPVIGPNYYAQPYAPPVPVTAGKKHTARNITLLAIALCLITSGIAVTLIFTLILHNPLQKQLSSGQLHATPTANVVTQYPSYLPGNGNLAMYDQLQHAANWNDSPGGHCVFVNNAFHVRTITNNVLYNCYAQPSNVALKRATDSAFEVQMTIAQGDCGGLAVRATPSDFPPHEKFYAVSICQDGKFAMYKYNVSHQGYDIVRDYAYSAAFNQGINQENTVAIVAIGSTLSVFLNKQQVADVQDTSLTQGTFGLIASAANHNITEVVYREAKVWTF